MSKQLLTALMTMTMALAAGAETTFTVSPSGSDRASGSSWRPFATLDRARRAVREARKVRSKETFTVVLKDGVYPLTNSLALGAEDSSVTYRAANRGRALVIGGIPLSLAEFGPCTNVALLSRIRPEVRRAVVALDLSARLPQAIPEPKDSFKGTFDAPYLCANGQFAPLARWPNEDWSRFTNIVDNGQTLKDPKNPKAGFVGPVRPGAFTIEGDRPAGWRLDAGVWLLGYWMQDWDESTVRVGSYDASTRVIRLAAPCKLGHGWAAAKGRPFCALNVLEELDAPGEWFLDRATKTLLYYPDPSQPNRDLFLATLKTPLVAGAKARDLVFDGIDFAYSRGDGLRFTGCTGLAIRRCRVRNIVENGIVLDGSRSIVADCDIYNIGGTAVCVSGGDRKSLTKAGNVIENNDIYRFGRFRRTYHGGVTVTGCGQIVRNNHLHDGPHLAILYSGNEHLLELNEVDNVLQETGDAGAFYTGRDWTSQGNIVRHNYFHDLGGARGQSRAIMGIYLDDCDSGDTLDGNLFYRAGNALFIGGGRDNTIVNNLVLDCVTGIHLDSRGMTWWQWNNKADASWCLENKALALGYTNALWAARYPRLAATMANSPKEPLGNVFSNNIVIDAQAKSLEFDKQVLSVFPKLACGNNVVVDTTGTNTTAQTTYDLDGFLLSVPSTPVFPIVLGLPRDGRALLSVKDSAWLMRAMPSLARIPVEKIGLHRADD